MVTGLEYYNICLYTQVACGFLCHCGHRSTGEQRPIAELFIPLGWNCNTFPQVMVSELLTESCAGRFPSNPQLQASVWACHRFEGPLVELSFWGPVENGICLSSVMDLVGKTPLRTHTHPCWSTHTYTHSRAHTHIFLGHIPFPSAAHPHSEAFCRCTVDTGTITLCLLCTPVCVCVLMLAVCCPLGMPRAECISLSVLPSEEKLTFF